MKVIFRKSKRSVSEFQDYLESRICTTNREGVNWVSKSPKHIILYYEDGRLTKHGDYQLIKTVFIGRQRIWKDSVWLSGIIVSGPLFYLFSLVSIFASLYIYCIEKNVELFIGILVAVLFNVWVFVDEKKNREALEKYILSNILERD